MSPTRRSFVKAAVGAFAAAPFAWPEPVTVAAVSEPAGDKYTTLGALTGCFLMDQTTDETIRYLAENVPVDRLAIRDFAIWCIEVFDRSRKDS